nr:hypothetical protein FNV92_20310 [Bradyrhizobium cosmicum]
MTRCLRDAQWCSSESTVHACIALGPFSFEVSAIKQRRNSIQVDLRIRAAPPHQPSLLGDNISCGNRQPEIPSEATAGGTRPGCSDIPSTLRATCVVELDATGRAWSIGEAARQDCATARWFCGNRTWHRNMLDRGHRSARIGLGWRNPVVLRSAAQLFCPGKVEQLA